MITLHSGQLRIQIDPQGAELRSIQPRDEALEYLWQGDPAYWSRRAPVLFPIVGRLKDDRYQWQGQWYAMGQHGFARDQVFSVEQPSPDEAWFTLEDTEASRARYPFAFRLRIGYQVQALRTRIVYEVLNPGTELLPFSIGGHPGFRCPLLPGEAAEAYRLNFEQDELAVRHLLEGGLYTGETETVLQGGRSIALTPDLFDQDALVFHGLQSRWVELRSATSGRGVRLHFEAFPYLGIWAKPGAPFVCLEPWQGLADYTHSSGDLTEKAGIHLLLPGQLHRCAYEIECL
ncbi:MAG: aldose 1-epimerase family protein [Bacteroidia bacterium]|nr:aldose 1-epimerase family protein [Bacteroidia bacterium]